MPPPLYPARLPAPPMPPTNTCSTVPGEMNVVTSALPPFPPVNALVPTPEPPAAPIATMVTDEAPGGTVYCCTEPVYWNVTENGNIVGAALGATERVAAF